MPGRSSVVLHPVAVHYKGSGFYSTDYGRKSKQPAKDSGSGESSSGSSGGESGGGSGSDSGGSRGVDLRRRQRCESKKAAEACAQGGSLPATREWFEISTFTSPICDVFGARLRPVPRVGGG